MGATAHWMDEERRSRPHRPRRRVRWDRIVIAIIILALAIAFWWTFLSIVFHQLTAAGF
jgi:hypothetical protein